jgi:NADH-quinone oxidoreductase subunit L
MVTAGVYLLGRLFPFYLSDTFAADVRTIIIVIGGITLFFMGMLAFVQNDIKRVLAYSTVSQLGYMVAAMGAGAYTAGLFHLFTHAFFKALLFLGAGSVIHAVHSNNMSDMGGLRKYMKYTYWTFLIGTAALIGLFPFSGFWSKDEIIASIGYDAQTHGEAAAWFVLVLSILGAFVTAFYMTRAVSLTFFGEYKGHGEPHESPRVMTYPLVALSVGAIAAGWLNIPGVYTGFTEWVGTRAFAMGDHHPDGVDWPLILIVTPLVLIGVFIGWRIFGPDRDTQRERDRFRIPVLYPLLEHKYYLDDLYLDGIMRPTMGPVARGVLWFDMNVVDGVVNTVAAGTKEIARQVNVFDLGGVDTVYNVSAAGVDATGGFLRRFFTGRVQQYAAFGFAGAVIIAALFIIL